MIFNPSHLMRRNINRRRTTTNRYAVDNSGFWDESLHARVSQLNIKSKAVDAVSIRVNNGIFNFPVDVQSQNVSLKIMTSLTSDYFNFVGGRRVAKYTEIDGYWTESKISTEIVYAFLMALWDTVSQILIDNYPLISDDLRHRTGRTFSNDNKESYHDSHNLISSDDSKNTSNKNDRNKIAQSRINATGDNLNSRSTDNSTTVNDGYASPQNQGVLPSAQSDEIMNLNNFQSPDNMGVRGVIPNGDKKYSTDTNINIEGSTGTISEGRSHFGKEFDNRVSEDDYLDVDTKFSSKIEGNNNIGTKKGFETGVERFEDLDISGVLQNFYDLFSDRILMEIDNRMLPFYLNIKISRFKDFSSGTKKYI